MRFIHCDKEDFLAARGNRKVVCIGASGSLFEAVEALCLRPDDIRSICDNSAAKQGTEVSVSGVSFVVRSVEESVSEIASEDRDDVILITSRFYEQIAAQLDDMKELDGIECYAYPCLALYLDRNKDTFFYKRLIDPCLYTYDEILGYQDVPEAERRRLLKLKRQELLERMDGEHHLTIPRVVFSHWNKCNLQCEHCGAFMPDVDTPYHIPSEQVLKDAALFLRAVDECFMVDITDGEPFLNPELDILLHGLTQNPKIHCVFFYTNGTHMPSEKVLRELENPKVIVMMSDYGFLDKMARMIEVFEKRGIHFRVITDMYWKNSDSMEDRGRNPEFLKYHFLNCEAGRTRKRMAYGKLWTCTRSFRFHTLQLFESENDYVELKETDSDEELRRKILKLYLTDTADACNYCDYGNMAGEIVRAGIQRNQKVRKSDYTIISRAELEALKGMGNRL